MNRYRDRAEAGRVLASHLSHYANRHDVLVLALPRGGVPVAWEVAQALGAPLDIFLVRKLGLPGQEELAMGAVASGGTIVMNEELMFHLSIPQHVIDQVVDGEMRELKRREDVYRGGRPATELEGQTVILVDDGLATGSSMRAAAEALRLKQPQRIIVAVPVAPASTCEEFRAEVDEVVCARTPEPFYAVGMWYDDFNQTTDDEVRELLARGPSLQNSHSGANHPVWPR